MNGENRPLSYRRAKLGLENYRSFERILENLYLELIKGNPNDENTKPVGLGNTS
jgi:hypothetical protein